MKPLAKEYYSMYLQKMYNFNFDNNDVIFDFNLKGNKDFNFVIYNNIFIIKNYEDIDCFEVNNDVLTSFYKEGLINSIKIASKELDDKLKDKQFISSNQIIPEVMGSLNYIENRKLFTIVNNFENTSSKILFCKIEKMVEKIVSNLK